MRLSPSPFLPFPLIPFPNLLSLPLGVTYLNMLGRFTDPHTLECKDKGGKTKVISAARFVVATGGRPTPLACEGGELAITSDDIFTLDKPPGMCIWVRL
ncbi:hypothetical protein EON63_10270 [archaeon]|nr:MAG: hypothetical protein EON63_10270 [archaeon]